MEFKKITEDLYVCKFDVKGETRIFTLTLQKIGVLGYGKSFVLRGKIADDKMEIIASLWVADDGYQTYRKDSHNLKLWGFEESRKESMRIIMNIVENIY